MDFLPIDVCKKIQEKTNLKSLFVYNKEQIINPEIIEKHGDLTDDGYYELTKDCGGPYKFNEVYIYDYKLMLKRDVWVGKEMVYAYTIQDAINYLLNKGILITTFANRNNYSMCAEVLVKDEEEYGWVQKHFTDFNFNENSYEAYEECMMEAINFVINNLI
jgi:hypothetical protein